MMNLSCETKFRVYEPLEEYHQECPYILVTVKGEHPHPIPLSQKTPPAIRSDIFNLLASLDEDHCSSFFKSGKLAAVFKSSDLTKSNLLQYPRQRRAWVDCADN